MWLCLKSVLDVRKPASRNLNHIETEVGVVEGVLHPVRLRRRDIACALPRAHPLGGMRGVAVGRLYLRKDHGVAVQRDDVNLDTADDGVGRNDSVAPPLELREKP